MSSAVKKQIVVFLLFITKGECVRFHKSNMPDMFVHFWTPLKDHFCHSFLQGFSNYFCAGLDSRQEWQFQAFVSLAV